MPPPSAASTDPNLRFDISYDSVGGMRNTEWKGAGELVIDPAGPTYTFAGRPRQLIAREPQQVTLTAADIINVVQQDRSLQFQRRRTGADTGTPFVFHARNATEARAIADLLPAGKDATFVAEMDFHRRLHALAGRRGPLGWATNVLIALNVAAFLVMVLGFGAGWLEVTDLRPYIAAGASNGAATTGGEWWRLVTSMFLHYGIIHLALNMWALFAAGHLLEKLLGTGLFVILYLGAGLAGGFASIAWYGDAVWSAGASGAVFGVFGGVLGYMVRQRQAVPRTIFRGLLRSSLLFAGYNILFGLARTGIDNAAHGGGFLTGLILGWLLARPLEIEARRALAARCLALGLAALVVIVAGGVMGTPRFDYRIEEEFALHDLNRDRAPRERELEKRNREALASLRDQAAAREHAAWVEREMLPFYRGWSASVAALELDPAYSTARQRERLLEIFRLRLLSLERLTAGLRRDPPAARSRYLADEVEIAAALAQLRGEDAGP